jgi:hypothetical protein
LIFQIYVSQLSLMSHSSVIQRLLSANDNAVVQKGESIIFGLLTGSHGVGPESSGIRVTSVQTKGGKHFGVEEPPFIDFVKPAFAFSGRKKEPVLARDVLIAVWRGATSTTATGFVFVPIKDESNVAMIPDFDAIDSNDGGR